jgi:HD-like signal output (HDOD) protein
MEDLERPFPNAHELLNRVVDICPFPATAQRLMALVNDDKAPLDAIAAAVQCDPALATQVLRVSNSAVFRHSGSEPIRDLRQALLTVGLEELRVMAGAMALLATFATRDELSLDLHRTSAVSGSIADVIGRPAHGSAKSLPLICGLLCEVGALACLAVDGPGYVDLWLRTVGGGRRRWTLESVAARDAMEVRRYGVTTRIIGARLLTRHRLPPEIGSAIEAGADANPRAPLLHRATTFARIATPLVVDALGTSDKAALTKQIEQVATITAIVELDADELVRRCSLAAASMERTIRAARD